MSSQPLISTDISRQIIENFIRKFFVVVATYTVVVSISFLALAAARRRLQQSKFSEHGHRD